MTLEESPHSPRSPRQGDASPEPPTCCVCLERLDQGPLSELPCQHRLHTRCLSRWLCSNPRARPPRRCPLCNSSILARPQGGDSDGDDDGYGDDGGDGDDDGDTEDGEDDDDIDIETGK